MDIPLPRNKSAHRRKQLIVLGVLLLSAAIALFGWSRLSQQGPRVALNSLVTAKVTRGELLREVRAPGVLTPTELRWIAALTNGRVEKILAQPGTQVAADTPILLLTNPQLSRDLETARYNLQVSGAQLEALKVRLQSERLTQQALVAEYETRYETALFRSQANAALADKNIVSALDRKEAELLAEQLRTRLDVERQRLSQYSALMQAEINAEQARVQQARGQVELQQELVNSLSVRSGLPGMLQEVPVEQGQQISAGTILARVASADSFKAELRVAESQAKDLRLGQQVTVMAGNLSMQGAISRIDPAVQNAVVLVDVQINSELIPGARPDLRIEGVIEIERLADVLLINRPVNARENGGSQVFVLDRARAILTRREVTWGTGSIGQIIIEQGLQPDEEIVLSDLGLLQQQAQILLY